MFVVDMVIVYDSRATIGNLNVDCLRQSRSRLLCLLNPEMRAWAAFTINNMLLVGRHLLVLAPALDILLSHLSEGR